MPQPVEPMTVVSLASLAVLCALALKKIFVTDRFHALRVVILTALLWVAVAYLFLLSFPALHFNDCMPPDDEECAYTITEM